MYLLFWTFAFSFSPIFSMSTSLTFSIGPSSLYSHWTYLLNPTSAHSIYWAISAASTSPVLPSLMLFVNSYLLSLSSNPLTRYNVLWSCLSFCTKGIAYYRTIISMLTAILLSRLWYLCYYWICSWNSHRFPSRSAQSLIE